MTSRHVLHVPSHSTNNTESPTLNKDATLPLTATFASLLITHFHPWPLNQPEESPSLAHPRKELQELHRGQYKLAARKQASRSVLPHSPIIHVSDVVFVRFTVIPYLIVSRRSYPSLPKAAHATQRAYRSKGRCLHQCNTGVPYC